MSSKTARPLFDWKIVSRAIAESFWKLSPRHQFRNPVMFTVLMGSLLTTALAVRAVLVPGTESAGFVGGIAAWLWFTLLFANFAEAMAEGRGKAQADGLRKSRKEVMACRLTNNNVRESVLSSQLKKGDVVIVVAGEVIPIDGEVIDGVASVDESAITGESAPVIRESGGDRSAVTGGTRVISDSLTIRATSSPGESFLDRMINMVEGAKRQKTPNEIALNILLAAMTIVFLLASATLVPFSEYSVVSAGKGTPISLAVVVALLVCLIPTTIGGLLSAIGIAGMDRMIQANVIATSGRAVEAAGDIDVLLLDKTGTITLGNRQAVEFVPAEGVTTEQLADAAQLSSLSDETPEGRSIVVLAKTAYGLRGRNVEELRAKFVPFSARTRMSGVDLDGREIRKGAVDAMENYVKEQHGEFPRSLKEQVNRIANLGGTPLVVAEGKKSFGRDLSQGHCERWNTRAIFPVTTDGD